MENKKLESKASATLQDALNNFSVGLDHSRAVLSESEMVLRKLKQREAPINDCESKGKAEEIMSIPEEMNSLSHAICGNLGKISNNLEEISLIIG